MSIRFLSEFTFKTIDCIFLIKSVLIMKSLLQFLSNSTSWTHYYTIIYWSTAATLDAFLSFFRILFTGLTCLLAAKVAWFSAVFAAERPGDWWFILSLALAGFGRGRVARVFFESKGGFSRIDYLSRSNRWSDKEWTCLWTVLVLCYPKGAVSSGAEASCPSENGNREGSGVSLLFRWLISCFRRVFEYGNKVEKKRVAHLHIISRYETRRIFKRSTSVPSFLWGYKSLWRLICVTLLMW